MNYARNIDAGKDGDYTMAKRSGVDEGAGADADNVVDLSGRRKPPSRKGIPATAAQKAALAKGTAGRKAASKAAKEARGDKKPKSRWKKLIAGEITVSDLEIEELKRMQTRDALGAFTTANRDVPAKLARDMKAELLRRGQAVIDSAYPEAIDLLRAVVADKRQKTTDRIKAAQLIVERSAGRMPETVRLEKSATWDETFEDVVTTTEEVDTA